MSGKSRHQKKKIQAKKEELAQKEDDAKFFDTEQGPEDLGFYDAIAIEAMPGYKIIQEEIAIREAATKKKQQFDEMIAANEAIARTQKEAKIKQQAAAEAAIIHKKAKLDAKMHAKEEHRKVAKPAAEKMLAAAKKIKTFEALQAEKTKKKADHAAEVKIKTIAIKQINLAGPKLFDDILTSVAKSKTSQKAAPNQKIYQAVLEKRFLKTIRDYISANSSDYADDFFYTKEQIQELNQIIAKASTKLATEIKEGKNSLEDIHQEKTVFTTITGMLTSAGKAIGVYDPNAADLFKQAALYGEKLRENIGQLEVQKEKSYRQAGNKGTFGALIRHARDAREEDVGQAVQAHHKHVDQKMLDEAVIRSLAGDINQDAYPVHGTNGKIRLKEVGEEVEQKHAKTLTGITKLQAAMRGAAARKDLLTNFSKAEILTASKSKINLTSKKLMEDLVEIIKKPGNDNVIRKKDQLFNKCLTAMQTNITSISNKHPEIQNLDKAKQLRTIINRAVDQLEIEGKDNSLNSDSKRSWYDALGRVYDGASNLCHNIGVFIGASNPTAKELFMQAAKEGHKLQKELEQQQKHDIEHNKKAGYSHSLASLKAKKDSKQTAQDLKIELDLHRSRAEAADKETHGDRVDSAEQKRKIANLLSNAKDLKKHPNSDSLHPNIKVVRAAKSPAEAEMVATQLIHNHLIKHISKSLKEVVVATHPHHKKHSIVTKLAHKKAKPILIA